MESDDIIFFILGRLAIVMSFSAAACIAREMGIPMRVVCSLSNDALIRAVHDNDYSVGKLKRTLAPAIDLQVRWQNFSKVRLKILVIIITNYAKAIITSNNVSSLLQSWTFPSWLWFELL